ncbi:TPA: hypothetical protein JL175_002413 [Escherichia coli]|nr:hypothetical protein [Escherichia coli]
MLSFVSASLASVFPAPAGINRTVATESRWRGRVPRASGDKPSAASWSTPTPWCSPRQRG